MKVFVIGNGFIADHLPYQKIDRHIPVNAQHIEDMFNINKPDVIINCIGKTGRPNIDWCENNKEETTSINTALPILLAESCAKHSIHMIQVGSGCVYFGESPNIMICTGVMPPYDKSIKVDMGWKEIDFANPKSYYSKTKYACDLAIGDMLHVTTLRIRMPLSNKDNPRNLINKLKGYSKVIDIPNSITFMDDLVRCIKWSIDGNHTGIFHVVNPQPLTAAQIMREYQKYKPEHKFEIITENQLDELALAKRSNCILSSQKLREAGFYMTPSVEALENCMAAYIKQI